MANSNFKYYQIQCKTMIRPSTEIVKLLKKQWDRSKESNRCEWRVLGGRNQKGRYDLFISTPERIWQLKLEQTGDKEAIGFGLEVGKPDDDLRKLFMRGAPVPFGLISPSDELAIVMAGIQQYSSESTYTLCRNYISDKQAELDERLDCEIERMKSNPLLRYRYREQKEREMRAYL